MEFLVNTTLGMTEIMTYQKATCKTVQKLKMTALHWGLIGVGLIGLTSSGIALANPQGGVGGILGLVLSVLSFVWGVNWYRYLTFKAARKVPADFHQEFYFDDTNLVAQAGTEKVVHTYRQFYALAETEDYFILFLHKGAGYVLDKKGFAKGEPGQFGAFIQEKTGKTLPFVKI